MPSRGKRFLFPPKYHTGFGTYLTSYSVSTGSVFLWGQSDHSPHLAPRLRMTAALLLLALCAIMGWTGTALVLTSHPFVTVIY